MTMWWGWMRGGAPLLGSRCSSPSSTAANIAASSQITFVANSLSPEPSARRLASQVAECRVQWLQCRSMSGAASTITT